MAPLSIAPLKRVRARDCGWRRNRDAAVEVTRASLGSTHVSGTSLHHGAGSVTAPSGQREERPVAPKAAAGSSAETSDARAQVARLETLDGAGLREEWRRLYRAEPPRLSRDLLTRALAYRIQEVAFGGLPKLAL